LKKKVDPTEELCMQLSLAKLIKNKDLLSLVQYFPERYLRHSYRERKMAGDSAPIYRIPTGEIRG
jgi:hypothetical protein